MPIAGKAPDIDEINEGKTSSFLFSDGEDHEHRLTLTADWMAKRPVRSSRLVRAKAGYIKFDGFIAGTGNWLRDEMKKLDSPAAVILDLRGNRGGYVDEVRNCLAQFFATDTELGSFVERTGKAEEPKIRGKKDNSFKGKIAVLVDEESYSGAEIFAQVMQESGRGKIVGTHTKGEVLNSMEFGLPGDFRTSIAFRDYRSPKGQRIEGKGVKPDVEVPITIEDIARSHDAALEKALETIK